MKTNNRNPREVLRSLDLEQNQKSVTTRGGVYVASCDSITHAKALAAAPKLLKLIEELYGDDKAVQDRVEQIFQEVA